MDRLTHTLLEGLKKALEGSGEQRLYRSGKLDGLFPGRSGQAQNAATQALQDNLLELVRTETRGKTTIEWVRLTPKGVDFIHTKEAPIVALRDLQEILRCNRAGVPRWFAELHATLESLQEGLREQARRWSDKLQALEKRTEEALQRLEAAAPLVPPEITETYPWAIDALNYLDRRRQGGACESCPLPELFEAVQQSHADLSVAGFHEGLRKLHDRRGLRLEPAPEPDALSHPEYALFDGATVLYYATR
jgi:hypothetical protein